jgi:hypothetical protein
MASRPKIVPGAASANLDKANERPRRARRARFLGKSEPDDLMRLLRAIGLGLEPEALHALAVIAEGFELRKKLKELEKEMARIKANLSVRKRWRRKRLADRSRDPQAKAPKTPAAPTPSAVDMSSDFAHLPQEPSPAEDPLESLTTPEASRPCPNGAMAAAPSSPASMTVMSPAPPCVPGAPDSLGEPMLSPTSGSEGGSGSSRSGAWQHRRIKWAVERLYPEGVPDGINVTFLTKTVADELASAEAKKAGMSDGGAPSWKSVKRFVSHIDRSRAKKR